MTAAAETRAPRRRSGSGLVSAADRGSRAFLWGRRLRQARRHSRRDGGDRRWSPSTCPAARILLGSLCVFLAIFLLSTIGSGDPWECAIGRATRRGRCAAARSRLLRRTAARSRGRGGRGGAGDPAVEEALGKPQGMLAVQARHGLDAALDKHLAFARKGAVREYTESIGGAILVALLLRAFVFEPFHIPPLDDPHAAGRGFHLREQDELRAAHPLHRPGPGAQALGAAAEARRRGGLSSIRSIPTSIT